MSDSSKVWFDAIDNAGRNTVAIFTSPMSFIKWATALEQKGYAITVRALNGRLFASATRK